MYRILSKVKERKKYKKGKLKQKSKKDNDNKLIFILADLKNDK